MRRSLLLWALLLATVAWGAEDWQPLGRQARILLHAEGDSLPVSRMVALPETGEWRVLALELDGRSADPAGRAYCTAPFVFRRVRAGNVVVRGDIGPWREAWVTLGFDRSLPETGPSPEDRFLDGLLANPGQARPRQAAASSREEDEIFDGSNRWLRLDYTEEGFYRLGYVDLIGYGLSSDIDPATFRLLGRPSQAQPFENGGEGGSWERGWDLEEIPLDLVGGGSLGPETELRFWLPGLDHWADRLDPEAGWEDWQRHPYAVWSTVWLTWGGAPGLRISEEAVGDADPQDPTVESVPARLHREKNQYYSNKYLHEDGWAWNLFLVSSQPEYFQDQAELLWPRADRPVRLRIGYDAELYPGEPTGPHHVLGYLGSQQGQPDPAQLLVDESFDIDLALEQVVLEGEGLLPNLEEGQSNLPFWLVLPKDELARDYGYLLWYQVFYETRLRTSLSAPLDFTLPAQGGNVNLEIGGWSAEPELWDLSDALAPRRLSGGSYDSGTLFLNLSSEQARHLAAFDPSREDGFRAFEKVRRVTPRPLRHDALPHMIVVSHDAFSAPAERYAAWRAGHLHGIGEGEVEVALMSDIYANFSGGMQDVAGLRNFLRYRYETPGCRLSYVLLLGDADSDYRNFTGRDAAGDGTNTLVPALSDRFRAEQANLVYTTDDYFACMDDQDDSLSISVPDLALGRLPAPTLAAAEQMIDMVLDYERETPAGRWKNRAVLAADDFFIKCNKPDNIRHTEQAENLTSHGLPRELDLQKIYLCEYDCNHAGFKPEAQGDLLDALGDGVVLFNFVGHGGNDVLADEQLLLTANLYSLMNGGKRFLFISASCNVGEYDDPSGQSMAETMISLPDGGAIATMAASALTGALFNNKLNKNFLEQLYPDGSVLSSTPVGLALLRGKAITQLVDYGGSGAGASNERYSILGDPAMALAAPELSVDFDAASVDTMTVGGETVLTGRVLRDGVLAPDFNGEIHISVRASADTSGYDYEHYDNEYHADFQLPGAEVYRGVCPVENGRFTSPAFYFPRGSSVGPYGSIRAYAEGPWEAVGSRDSVPVVQGDLPDDQENPEVELSLSGGALSGVPGSPVILRASDESGINLVGGSPRTALILEYVESGEVEELTDRFQYDSGSAVAGQAQSTLRTGLDPGLHTLVASVADNLGNVGRDTLQIRLLEEGRFDLLAVQPFPNPFEEHCALTFELTAPARVEARIYSLSGRRIRTLVQDCPQAGRHEMAWNGRDELGDRIANGTYLFQVTAEFDDEGMRRRQQEGAIVKMSGSP